MDYIASFLPPPSQYPKRCKSENEVSKFTYVEAGDVNYLPCDSPGSFLVDVARPSRALPRPDLRSLPPPDTSAKVLEAGPAVAHDFFLPPSLAPCPSSPGTRMIRLLEERGLDFFEIR